MTENPPAGSDEQEKDEAELWTVSAGGFSATVDAFAVEPPEEPNRLHGLWLLSMVGPQASLKAVWASLLNMPPKPAHLTPGADGLLLGRDAHLPGANHEPGHLDHPDHPASQPDGLARHDLHQAG